MESKYDLICAWPLLLSLMFLIITHVVYLCSVLLIVLEYSVVMTVSQFVYSFSCLGFFHVGATVIKALWAFGYESLCGHLFSFLMGKHLDMGLGGYMLSFLRNWTISQSGCIILVLVVPYAHQHLMWPIFLAILKGGSFFILIVVCIPRRLMILSTFSFFFFF